MKTVSGASNERAGEFAKDSSALVRFAALLEPILTAFLAIFADHGADEDWGALC